MGAEADAFAALEHVRAGDWDQFLPQFRNAIKTRARIIYGPPPPWPTQPERTPEMIELGQVWAGMTYPDGSHGWEIRGTGVLIDGGGE